MKILFVIPSIATGGQERAGMYLCNFLMKYHEVQVVCFSPEQKNDYDYKCPVIRIEVPSRQGLSKISSAIGRLRSLRKIKKEFRPDVSIAFGNTAIILNQFAGGSERKIASVRQSFKMLLKDSSLSMRIHLKAYLHSLHKADQIVSVSSELNEELWNYFRIRNSIYINNCVDKDLIQSQGHEKSIVLNKSKRWIAHSGRFDPSKGQWHLVQVFSIIRESLPGTGLIFLGSVDGSSAKGQEIYSFCKSFLDSKNLSWTESMSEDADVIFAGHQENPFQYISQSEVFVLPSLWEGFPNALLEAMCLAKPVIAADCHTGPSDIINHPGNGKLLPPFTDISPLSYSDDPLHKLWAEEILQVMSNEEIKNSLSISAKKRAEDFSIDMIGQQWLQLLEAR